MKLVHNHCEILLALAAFVGFPEYPFDLMSTGNETFNTQQPNLANMTP